MKCAICKHGETNSGQITVVLERKNAILIFKNVPAEICENCGEEYVSSDVNNRLLSSANEAAEKGIDLEILKYAA
jgi:YgiT-type zinc finger domain-containing protein